MILRQRKSGLEQMILENILKKDMIMIRRGVVGLRRPDSEMDAEHSRAYSFIPIVPTSMR